MDSYATKIVNHLCKLLRAEKAATAKGDVDEVMLCRAKFSSCSDALKLTLSELYVARLEREAIKRVNDEDQLNDQEGERG